MPYPLSPPVILFSVPWALASPQEVDAVTVKLKLSVSLGVVMNTDINNWSYLGAQLRDSTSCYKPFEVTIIF